MYYCSAFLNLLLLGTLSLASPVQHQQSSGVQKRQSSGSGQLLADENGVAVDMSWLNQVAPGSRSSINIPDVVSNGNLIHPAPPGSTPGQALGGGPSGGNAGPSSTSDSSQPGNTGGAPPPPPPPPSPSPSSTSPSSSAAPPAPPSSTPGSTGNSTGGGTPTTSGAGGCPAGMKGVTFNGGFNPGMFDTIGAAESWITFGDKAADGASSHAKAGYIPMMAFASDVSDAVKLITPDNSTTPSKVLPEWLLTFNEPDFSYMGSSPTMSPQQAADAIKPLLDVTGTTTKFVAPVPADSGSTWLNDFFTACNCKSRFSAYNIHIYAPTSAEIISKLTAFRGAHGDMNTWITEVAPGSASPACSLGWDTVTGIMNDVYKFAHSSGYVDRVFWNTGNQIGGDDHNVCNSYLLDSGGNPSPLMKSFQNVNCS